MEIIKLYLILFGVSIFFQASIVYLFKKKKIFQNIYNLSPQSHQKKSSTPSMGGVGMLLTIGVSFFMFNQSAESQWLIIVVFLFGFIGLLDDGLSLILGKNQGLRTAQKFGIQVLFSVWVLGLYSYQINELSVWEFVLYAFCFTGMSNATNLTDGLDGLLAGSSILTLGGFLCLMLSYQFNSGVTFVVCVMISVISFLFFNRHPALIFMGDTGSLFLGAFFCALSILLGNIWIIIPFCALYILEAVSVIVQVLYFKWSKKRIFLMSPIHHHYELLGLKETTIVLLLWCVQLGFIVYAFSYLI
jgi:phospho-N-acetylmuramoyl-pentapeptide-transferase